MTDIYITGFGGRFPSSHSLKDFWANLCEGVDLVTSCADRYPEGYHGLPPRQAQIKTLAKFDAMFFGISAAQAACLDPQVRMLLESVYEAIADAGYCMSELAGSNTGVYVGGCFSDLHKAMLADLRLISGYENTGCSHSMFSNRVSFCFDFKGPSYTVDTACSSSLVAMDHAVRDLRSGRITRAVVGGVSVVTDPAVSKSFQKFTMLSPSGKCHSFDDRADGYVRADAVGAVLLESSTIPGVDCGILRILGTGCNSDGWKAKGITYPSAAQQKSLYRLVAAEARLDVDTVEYVEAHGTGTVAGDGVELAGIDAVFSRTEQAVEVGVAPVLVGSVKSNMGHSEGASGMMSLVKVCGIFTDRYIPTNIHFQSTSHAPILASRLRVVDSTRPFQGGRIVINNFGFGGTNANLVAEPGGAVVNASPALTRFVFGRSRMALEHYVDCGDLNAAAWAKHLPNSVLTGKFPFRGVIVSSHPDSDPCPDAEVELSVSEIPSAVTPVAFCFSGQGCQWNHMAADLFREHPVFRETVCEAAADLPLAEKHGVTVKELFEGGELWLSRQWSGLGITLVQIGLTAALRDAGVVPDYIFGHSVGEVACGYADGCTSAREAARIAYVRCSVSDKIAADGLMLAAGLPLVEAQELLRQYPETVVACHNSPDGVTLSGSAAEIQAIAAGLETRGVFARVVPTDGIAYHSLFFKRHLEEITELLAGAITDEPRIARSTRFLPTSQSAGTTDCADEAYHAGNIVGMVDFAPVVASLPAGTLVVEVGPHALLKSAVARSNSGVTTIGCMARGESGLASLQRCIDALWLGGARLSFPKQSYLVPLKHRLNVQWDHAQDWRVPSYKDFQKGKSTVVSYDLAGRDSYLMDHVIDGRALFPATGHVVSAWQAYNNCTLGIEFTDVKILSAVIMDGGSISFTVTAEERGFAIAHEGVVVATGCVARSKLEGPVFNSPAHKLEGAMIAQPQIYAYFARFGYGYKQHFRLIQHRSVDGEVYRFATTQHWIPYLDCLLQVYLRDPSGLYLPTEIGSVAIRTSNVEKAGSTVFGSSRLGAVGNAMVAIRGLKTTLSKKTHRPVPLRSMQFVPYGDHLASQECPWALTEASKSTPSNYATQCLDVLLQIVKENTGRALNVTELVAAPPSGSANITPDSVSDVDSLTKLVYPLLASDLERYHCCNVNSAVQTVSSAAVAAFGATYPGAMLVNQLDLNTLGADKSGLGLGLSSAGNPPVDLLIASQCLYLSTNLAQTLAGAQSLLSESGFLIISEAIRRPVANDSRSHSHTCSRSSCVDLPLTTGSASTTTLTLSMWKDALCAAGYEVITNYVDGSFSADHDAGAGAVPMLLLAKKVFLHAGAPQGVVDEQAIERVVASRAEVCPGDMRQLLVTDDFGLYAFTRSLRKEPGYANLRVCYRAPAAAHGERGDRTQREVRSSLPLHAVSEEGVLGGYHELPLTAPTPAGMCTPIPDVNPHGYHVEVSNPGDMTSLGWVGNDETTTLAGSTINTTPNCDVGFCGINFKDVMLSYGRLQQEGGGPVKIGLEFAGRRRGVVEVGAADPRVMGISAGCMGTQVWAPEHLLWEVPPSMTLEQACTVPVVYATAYYALVCRARIQSGQTVLLHSIAGGVGQAAYHVCRHRGCEVIATCARDKHAWVAMNLGLSPDRILDSHTTLFRDEVLALTDGRGVDVVLNSLSGEKLLASLDCVAKYGHFCEIGKYDIQQNSAVGLGAFERNISMHAFDLGDMFHRPVLWRPVRGLIGEGLRSGEIKPLCTTVFETIEPALRCISQGKHVGKVVVKVADLEGPGSSTCTGPYSDRALAPVAREGFRTSGVHLVVGGLGGFGLEVVNWLYQRGAQRVEVVSRSAPKSHHHHLLRGGTTSVHHTDLTDITACDALCASLGADLVGIWHLGMVLNDCLYANMTEQAWDETVRVKATIATNLDTASRVHNPCLKQFVMWSSVSSLFGNPGQTNYAYANAAMEHVCMVRRCEGLCAVAIQWGFIGGVGVLAGDNLSSANSTLAFLPQHIDSCLDTLADAVRGQPHAVVSSYIRRSQDALAAPSGVLTLAQRIARVLGVDIAKIKAEDSLAGLGMDSLQSVEVTNILKAAGALKKVSDLRNTAWSIISTL